MRSTTLSKINGQGVDLSTDVFFSLTNISQDVLKLLSFTYDLILRTGFKSPPDNRYVIIDQMGLGPNPPWQNPLGHNP